MTGECGGDGSAGARAAAAGNAMLSCPPSCSAARSSDNVFMPFDALVANPGRLRILTALAGAGAPKQPFVELRRQTGLTDGNLSTHARRLQSAGFVAIEKSFDAGKPLTTLQLTARGRDALSAHAHALLRSLESSANNAAPASEPVAADDGHAEDDWVD